MQTMNRQIIVATYALALLAAAFISFGPLPVRYTGLALLIAAFALPLADWIIAGRRIGARMGIDMRRATLARALYQSPHINVGGTMGSYYIDIDSVQTDPKDLAIIGQLYVARIRDLQQQLGKIDRLAFIERDAGPIGAVGLLGFITAQTGIPSLIIRPRRLLRAGEVKPRGALQPHSRVVLVTDVATGGGTIRRAVEVLRRYTHQEQFHVVLLACRDEATRRNLESEGIRLQTLYDARALQDALEQRRAERTLSPTMAISP